MGKHQPAISRRGFVAASGAVALGAGLGATATGCSSGGGAAKGGDAQKEDKWVPTTCNMCFNQCSILAHVVDGKVVELKGNPDSPVGRGHICAKGASGIMQLYDPNRITKPMKRTNPKKGFDQDPGWEEISWDEAYELVNKNISEAIERSGPPCRYGHVDGRKPGGKPRAAHGPWCYLRQRRGKLLGHLRRWRAPA